MKTLIIPCAGKSSRFPNMKPKWLLTHPDGKLMIEKALEGINLGSFDRIVITIVKEHIEKFEAYLILDQIFSFENSKFEICILENFTSSQSETVFQTIQKNKIQGAVIIKDSDNYVKVDFDFNSNFVVGLNLISFSKEIYRLSGKSFLKINEQNNIIDIVEKNIISSFICVGIYGFLNVSLFVEAYIKLKNENLKELYLSNIISFLLTESKATFKHVEANDYSDWGTLKDWQIEQKRYTTYFVDLDGVIFSNEGRYGIKNWSNSFEILENNLKILLKLQSRGSQIIITTSRDERYREKIMKVLNSNGLFPKYIITNLNHSARVLINDFAPTNPYPSSISINIQRNSQLADFFPDLE
jgi:hypothetical protein